MIKFEVIGTMFRKLSIRMMAYEGKLVRFIGIIYPS